MPATGRKQLPRANPRRPSGNRPSPRQPKTGRTPDQTIRPRGPSPRGLCLPGPVSGQAGPAGEDSAGRDPPGPAQPEGALPQTAPGDADKPEQARRAHPAGP